MKIDAFINRQQKEQNKNLFENRVSEKNTSPSCMIICLIIIVLSVVVFIFPEN